MASLVKAVRVTSTGAINVGPARIRAIHVVGGAGAGRITITNGVGGPVALDFDVVQASDADLSIPDEGIRCDEGMVVSLFNNLVAATIIYG